MQNGCLISSSAAALLLGLTAAAAEPPAPVDPPRRYEQVLEIDLEDGSAALDLHIAPVYDAREWAFSARWDDCNLNSLTMREHMARVGLKGTFYLTQNDKADRFGPALCRQLMQDGCSIGGHSMTHPRLTGLSAGQIWWELCANRISREDDTDTTLNSLAFPYGLFRDDARPEAFPIITEAVRRAGYHHCAYATFVRDNPHLAPGECSTSWQVVPGDRVVDAEAFAAQLAKPVERWPDTYRKLSHGLHLGVHPWQQGEEWAKLDAVFQTIAGRPEWWYCSLTEWAAYARQAATARLQIDTATSTATRRRVVITRAHPGDLGDAVPLTCLARGTAVRAARLDGQPIDLRRQGDATILNLPHRPSLSPPRRIGHIEIPAEADTADARRDGADFPGLRATILPETARLTLTLEAPATADLSDIHVRFRLPLAFQPGVVTRTATALPAGQAITLTADLPAPHPDPAWTAGPRYWVAEINATLAQEPIRLFVTRLQP